MRILVTWSGDVSHQAARSLRDLLPLLLPKTEILLWDDLSLMARGRWVSVFEQELAQTEAAIPCVTRDNMASPWLNFQAGLLSSKLGRDRILPLLIDVAINHLSGPFSEFQPFSTSKPDLRRFVALLGKIVPEESPNESTLDRSFETWWPAIASSLRVFREAATMPPGMPKSLDLRGSMRRIQNIDELQAVVARDASKDELASVVVATMRESGVKVIRHAPQRATGADLAVWADQLDSDLGNPILVEIKGRIPDTATAAVIANQAAQYVNRSAVGTILVMYRDGPDPARINREFGSGSIIFVRLPDLLERLRAESFDAALKLEYRRKER